MPTDISVSKHVYSRRRSPLAMHEQQAKVGERTCLAMHVRYRFALSARVDLHSINQAIGEDDAD